MTNDWGTGAIVFVQAPDGHKDTNPQELQCTSHGWIEIRNQTYNSKCQSWKNMSYTILWDLTLIQPWKCSFGKGKSVWILLKPSTFLGFLGFLVSFRGVGRRYQIIKVHPTVNPHCWRSSRRHTWCQLLCRVNPWAHGSLQKALSHRR